MKPASTALKAHFEEETATLATCWKLTRRDNQVMGFCSHSKDISYEEVEYKASSGFTPSSISSHSGLAIDQLEVEAVIESGMISDADIHAGLYDFAEIDIFLLNYKDISQGALELRRGWLGEIKYGTQYFTAEVRGLTQKLSHTLGELYSPRCRAKLGDARCGISLAGYTDSGAITSITSQRVFGDISLLAEDGYYNFGLVTFLSGNNNGLSMEVKRYQSGVVELAMPMPYALAISDSYQIVAGCDKRFSTCIAVFSNAVNFRGEPHIPGNDKLFSGK